MPSVWNETGVFLKQIHITTTTIIYVINVCFDKFIVNYRKTTRFYFLSHNFFLVLTLSLQDVADVDQVADELEGYFTQMRTPIGKINKIRLVMRALALRIPPHLVNYVS